MSGKEVTSKRIRFDNFLKKYLNNNFYIFLIIAFIVFSITFLIFMIFSYFYLVNNTLPLAKDQARSLVVNFKPSSLKIVTNSPSSMDKNHSYIVKVDLVPAENGTISDLSIENAIKYISDLAPIGSQGASLKDAFGPDYTPVATATLTSGDGVFKVTASEPLEQPLDQPKVSWTWAVVPQSAGINYLDISVYAVWRSENGIERGPYVMGYKTLQIHVIRPTPVPTHDSFFHISPINVDFVKIFTYIVGFLGLGGGGIIVYITHRLKNRKKKNHTRKK